MQMYTVEGKSDGMKYNPFDGKIWCLRNGDSNPAVTLFDPATSIQTDYAYAAPPAHGGGYDDVVFMNGQIFISASNPNLQPPTPQTPRTEHLPIDCKGDNSREQNLCIACAYGERDFDQRLSSELGLFS
jgi:hypothetical protein